jgi:flavorubredoxin
MTTTISQIAPGIFRVSTLVPEVMPGGFSFNQFVLDADEPLVFHTGMRGLFPGVSEAVDREVGLDRIRWISFGHVEADECGAMNAWLAACPKAQVVHGEVACLVSLNDLADRPPRALKHGEVLELGKGRRIRLITTPHVPHAWESIVLFEESTKTLFCGDLFSHGGDGPPITEEDIVGRALALERDFPGATALTPATGATLRALAALEPRTLCVMHGSSFRGDGGAALRALASGYERMFEDARRSVASPARA